MERAEIPWVVPLRRRTMLPERDGKTDHKVIEQMDTLNRRRRACFCTISETRLRFAGLFHNLWPKRKSLASQGL